MLVRTVVVNLKANVSLWIRIYHSLYSHQALTEGWIGKKQGWKKEETDLE